MRVSDPSFFADDPYFSETLTSTQMPWVALEGLSGHSDALMIKESCVPIPPRRTKVEHFHIGSDEEGSNDGETYTGVQGRKRKTPELTADSLRAWKTANLKDEDDGKLEWADLKKLLEEEFKQGKPGENLMKSAGLGFHKTNGKRCVKDLATGKRLVPK